MSENEKLVERLLHAVVTEANDDYSPPLSEARSRHVARMDTMREAAALTAAEARIKMLEEALADVLATGLNGGNNVRLAFLTAGGKELSPELLAKAQSSEDAVQRARQALTGASNDG